jgi:tetratricopeptide (TPR) repeat protein
MATRTPRSADPEIAKLRRCIDRGQVEEARALLPALDRLGPDCAAEAKLLSARFAALSLKVIDAIRTIETVRKEHPADPDVYATAAEIYVAAGKLDIGWDEVKAGDAACGEAPELGRARGVLWISRSGGARKGLDLLEAARRADPDLPFLDRALSQAHLLVGKEDAAARHAVDALAHARFAASLDPDEVDARRFLSEVLVQNGDFEAGIAEIQRLVDAGEPLSSELALLHKKAGIAALLERARTRAVTHFAAARKLGLTDAELSTGARILEEEAAAKVEQGILAYKVGDFAAAKAGFREALDLDPDRIQAKNHLAVVLFKEADYSAAVVLWRAVLETAVKEALPLPEPVHLNLAQAEALSGDVDGARATLEDYLAREPDGRWAKETRAALLALPAKKSSD